MDKPETRRAIAAYAAEVAGTELDLDEQLEAAVIESLLTVEQQSRSKATRQARVNGVRLLEYLHGGEPPGGQAGCVI